MLAAASSVDTRLRSEVQVFGETYDRDDRKLLAEYFNQQGQFSISQEQFQTLYGRPFSHLDEKRVGEFSVYDSLDSLAAHSFLGKVVLFAAQRMIYSMFPGRSHKDPEVKMMLQGLHEGTIDSVLCRAMAQCHIRLPRQLCFRQMDIIYKVFENCWRRNQIRNVMRGTYI